MKIILFFYCLSGNNKRERIIRVKNNPFFPVQDATEKENDLKFGKQFYDLHKYEKRKITYTDLQKL